MSKFDNLIVTLGGETIELRCDGAALARLEELYDGKPFTEAVPKLAKELESRKFQMSKLADVVAAMAVPTDKRDLRKSKDGEGRNWVLDRIVSSQETTALMEAVASAIMRHFPRDQTEGTGDAGDAEDPQEADKA